MSANRQSLRGLATWSGAGVVITIGAATVVLCSWIFDAPVLDPIYADWVSLKANTAIGFILAGAALWAYLSPWDSPGLRSLRMILAGMVVALGAITMLEYISGRNLGIDQLLATDSPGAEPGDAQTLTPGRMSHLTAIAFILLGLAVYLLRWSYARRWLVPPLTIGVACLASGSLIGYLYNVPSLTGLEDYTRMSVLTSILFLAMCFAVTLSYTESGLASLYGGHRAESRWLRRSLPLIVVAPTLVGLARLEAERLGWFTTEQGTTVMVFATVWALFAVISFLGAKLGDEIQNSQRELEETATRLQSLLDNASDAIIATDSEMRIILFNRAAEEIFGYTSEDIIGRVLTVLIAPNSIKKHEDYFAEFTAGDQDSRPGAPRLLVMGRRWDGSEFPIETSISRQIFLGEVIYTSVIRDITELRAAEEDLRELARTLEARVHDRTQMLEARTAELAAKNAELEAFVYSASHDLKEPMRAVQSYSYFLREDCADLLNDEGREYLDGIEKASVRMFTLIEDLLTLSRAGRQDLLEWTDFSMNQAISSTLETFEARIRERNASVEVEPNLPYVHSDRTRVGEVLSNLISNALKFNRDDNPLVRIGMREADTSRAVFYVQDNGIGIEPEQHEKVFELFQRLYRREEFEGTGAGLAIVKRSLEVLGGRIWIESELGKGTTMLFTLPLASAKLDLRAIREEDGSSAPVESTTHLAS